MSEGGPAIDALRAAGVAHRVVRYADESVGKVGGLEAAERLGLDPATVFKTLVADVDGELVLVLVPVAARLDLDALARARGAARARLAPPAEAEAATASRLGAISPFGLVRALPVVVDRSAEGLARMYVSGGRHGLELGVAPADLVAVTGAEVADVRRVDSRA